MRPYRVVLFYTDKAINQKRTSVFKIEAVGPIDAVTAAHHLLMKECPRSFTLHCLASYEEGEPHAEDISRQD